jgi:hypothetical protein
MNKSTRRLAAVLVTGALVAAGVTLTATAANASQITGNIKLYAQGSANGTIASKQLTSGSSTTNPMYWGITVDSACPAGHRDGASIQIAQAGNPAGAATGGRIGGIGQLNTVDLDGTYGTNGLKASDTGIAEDESFTVGSQNPYVDNNKSLESAAPALTTGTFEVRYYCYADITNIDYAADNYFSITLNFDKTAHTWSTPVAKANSTTAITAQADQTAKSVTVSVAVKNAAGSAALTDATGTATVTETAATATTFPAVAVAAGIATFTTANNLPAGTYTFTVAYSGDSKYNGSTSASATTGINGANSGSTNVTFTVDQAANGSGITLSGVPAAVDLGHATVTGGLLTASNATAFSGITVTDNRQMDAANWSLTGQVGDFTNTTKSGFTLSGAYLGWTPFSQFGPAVAGAAVAPAAVPATTGGLKSSSTLATGAVTNGTPVSSVGAALKVAIPSNTVSGTYSGVLTLTLAG